MARVTYDLATKEAAIAQALTLGVTKAEKTTGIDRDTLSRWVKAAQSDPHATGAAVVLAVQEDAASKFQAIIDQGTSAILERIASPKERLGDVARAVEIAVTAHRLLTNQSSLNLAVQTNPITEVLAEFGPDEKDELRIALRDALDTETARRGFAELTAGSIPDRDHIFEMIRILEANERNAP